MVILTEGTNKLASILVGNTVISAAQLGFNGTDPTIADTGLTSADSTSLIAVSASSAGSNATFIHTFPGTSGKGRTYREFELQFANGDSLLRAVGGAIVVSTGFDLVTITTINVTRG